MALNSQQRRVLATILAVGRRKGATPRELKAAVETGLVESGLTNPSGGDRDSAGFRQERRSLYRDPTSVKHSAERFFDEARAANRGHGSAGQLAANVQRPAAQYRGRYDERSSEAEGLLGNQRPSAPSNRFASAASNNAAKGALVAQFLRSKNADPLDLALNVRALQQNAPEAPRAAPPPPSGGAGGGKVLELFYNGPGGVNIKNGKRVPKGFVSGHTDHVHVAAPRGALPRYKALARQMGLTITSTTGGKHAPGSYHYSGQAVDVAGDPARMAAFARRVASGG
jgi:hypothetical protein